MALLNRGLAHAKKHEHDKAITDFTRAVRVQPKLVGAFFNRGLAHFQRGQFNRAFSDFTKALRIDPSFAEAKAMRDEVLRARKQGPRRKKEPRVPKAAPKPRRFKGHNGVVRGGVISPDGHQVLSCGDDKTIRLWDGAFRPRVAPLRGP